MNRDIERAKALLLNSPVTCALVKGDTVYASGRRGVKPLLWCLESGMSFKGFSAADKVVGKAAAYLYALLGVKELYAPVVSEAALDVLFKYGIKISFDVKVIGIRNRDNTGMCPMESCVVESQTPMDALAKIKGKLKELSEK